MDRAMDILALAEDKQVDPPPLSQDRLGYQGNLSRIGHVGWQDQRLAALLACPGSDLLQSLLSAAGECQAGFVGRQGQGDSAPNPTGCAYDKGYFTG